MKRHARPLTPRRRVASCTLLALLALLALLPAALAAPSASSAEGVGASEGQVALFAPLLAGEHARAEERLRRGLEDSPEALDAALGLSTLLEARGDTEGAVEALLAGLATPASGPKAAGAAARLLALLHRSADGGAVAAPFLKAIVEGERAPRDPDLRALAALGLADVLSRAGEPARADAMLVESAGRLELVTLAGPFGRFPALALDRVHPPEEGVLDPAAWAPAADGLPPFRIDSRFAGGRIAVPVQFRGIGVVYAIADVVVSEPFEGVVRVGAPVSFRATIGGEALLKADRAGARPPSSLARRVAFEPGRHRIVVKLENAGRFVPLAISLEGVEGPLPAGLVDNVPVEGDARARARVLGEETGFDAERVSSGRGDLAAALAHAFWLRARDLDREARGVLEALREAHPETPLFAYLLAEHFKNASTGSAPAEDLARARQLYAAALAADPSLHRARLDVAQMDELAERLAEARRNVERVLEDEPGHVGALYALFRIKFTEGWLVEAEQLLRQARMAAPLRPALLEAEVELFERLGASRRLLEARREKARQSPLDEGWPEALARAGRLDEAIEAWRGLIALRPSYFYPWIGLIRALEDKGLVDAALDTLGEAEELFPTEPWIPRHRAGLLERLGRHDAATADLERTLELDPSQVLLRESLDARRGGDPLRRYLADIPELLGRMDRRAPPGVDSALLVDTAAVLIDRQGGQTELYQGVHAVYTRAGVENEGELPIQPGALLERVTIHKPEGRRVEVAFNRGAPVSLPSLEPGDVIEYVWRRYIPPSGLVPGGLDNSSIFLFQGPDRNYELSRYVVMFDHELDVEVCGNQEGLDYEESREGDLRVLSWTAERMPRLPVEPHVPNRMEITPHVRLGMNVSYDDIGERLQAALVDTLHFDPPLPEFAAEVRERAGENADVERLARTIHEVVSERMDPGGAALRLGRPASVAASAGEGHRGGVALALARHFGLDARVALARPIELEGRELDCPSILPFGYALVEIAEGERSYLLDFNEVDHPFDTLPLRFSGSDALVVPLDPAEDARVEALPRRDPGVLEELLADVAIDEGGSVSGTVTLVARGSLASVLRRVLSEVPEDRRPLAYQSLATRAFPGAEVLAHEVSGVFDDAEEVRIRIGFMRGAWPRRTPKGLALPMTTSSIPLLSEYANLQSRRYPLLVDLQQFRRDRISVRLPEGMNVLELPEGVERDSPFGRYRLSARIEDERVVIERDAALPPTRVETEEYEAFRAFARDIEKAESREIVLGVASPSLAP